MECNKGSEVFFFQLPEPGIELGITGLQLGYNDLITPTHTVIFCICNISSEQVVFLLIVQVSLNRSDMLATEKFKVTREDLEYKAAAVLKSLLLEMWRIQRCRKRLRLVCAEELPWRAQANLLLAQCQLDCLVKKLSPATGEMQYSTPQWLQLNSLAANISGAIPTDTRLMAGHNVTMETTSKPSLQMIELNTMMNFIARAVVSNYELFFIAGNVMVMLWPSNIYTCLEYYSL